MQKHKVAIGATAGFFAGEKVASSRSQRQMAELRTKTADAESQRERLAELNGALKDERVILEKRVRDLRTKDAVAQLQIATLRAQNKAYARVIAIAVWDATGQQGKVRFENLPEPGADKDYQMWVIDPRYPAPVSAGIFAPGTGTTVDVTFKPDQPIAVADKFAVSIERKGGSATPQGAIVLLSN